MRVHRLLAAVSQLSELESQKAINYAEFLGEFAQRRLADGDADALRWYDAHVMDLHSKQLSLNADAKPLIERVHALT